MGKKDALRYRIAPLEMTPTEFRKVGFQLVERIAEFLCSLPDRPVTPNEPPAVIREALGTGPLPQQGTEARDLLEEAADLLVDHSTFTGHPRFMAVMNSSAAPIGALGDLLAAAVNPNLGGWPAAPMGTEIEAQTIRWIAEMIGYPGDCGGLLVSGGNMGNFVGFLAARKAKASWDVRASGMAGKDSRRMRVYTSSETHTWIHKATDMFGLGTDAIRWIPVDERLCMDMTALRNQIQEDIEAGDLPFLVIGTAGTVSTGAVDPLPEIAAICREHDLWFHVDGAYGGFAAVLLNDGNGTVPGDLKGISEADSVAVDPHKWLYAPLEAGCALVRDAEKLRAAFSYHPPYYHFDERATNYVDYGPQNSRGFRALKVWLALKQVGAAGYRKMIADDIRLSRAMAQAISRHAELELMTQDLSIPTFRYVRSDLRARLRESEVEIHLDALNRELVDRLQRGGEICVSNAIVCGRSVLRA